MYEFYVSKSGNDRNDGSQSSPFLTIEKAQCAARELVGKNLDAPIKITVCDGEYETDGLIFDKRDSGTKDFPVTYCTCGKVTLNGAKILNPKDFVSLDEEEKKRLSDDAAHNVKKIDLKSYGLTRSELGEICVIGSYTTANKYDDAILSPMWCELFVDDKRMTVARYPNEGYLYTREVVREGQCRENANNDYYCDKKEWEELKNPLGDIRKIDPQTAKRASAWKTFDNVWIYGYPHYGWADDSTPVVSIDENECTMETKYASLYGVVEKAPYYFFNVFEELDTPGEWFLDRENGILYLYPPRNLNECTIELSITSNPIICLENTENIRFDGFVLDGTRGDAVNACGKNITFDNCEIKNCAGWGMKLCGEEISVSNCHIHHTGKGGIDIDGGDRNSLSSSGNKIFNNHIHHIAEIFHTYNPGVYFRGVNCVVSHNCIHDSSHQALCFSGNEHIIEYNEIYNVCLHADDSSAIYAGRDYTTCGNVIRYNYFHDISSEMETQHIGIFAVYCDDNLGSTAIYANIMHRCQSALLLHGGHDIIFKNNLIIDSCKKSTRCIAFHRYGYPDTLTGDGQHIENLAKVPWESDLWKEKYPHIGEYLTWDYKDEQSCPHYCDISNNMIISHKRIDINFPAFKEEYFNIIRNNAEIDDKNFVGIPEGEKLSLAQNRFSEIIPGFLPLPFDKIGICEK